MTDINAISAIGLNQDITKTAKTNSTEKVSFSSYMEETRDLDDIFERAAQKYDVPVELLKAIGKAESDYRPNVVSRSGAQGIMQLMPATAKYLGVKDSFDPEQNIMGGTKYIAELLDKYDGETKLALAAYNAGMGNVKKYGGVPPFEETQNYVVKVTKYMQENLKAGSVTLNKGLDGLNRGNMGNVTQRTATVSDWQLAPSELTKQATTSELSELFHSIFSYEDYLRLLELFYRDNGENKSMPYYS